MLGRKGEKGLLLVGQEKVPYGFRLRTGDPATQLMVPETKGCPPAKHPLLGRTGGYLSHGLIFLFLRYGTPDWAKGGEGRTVCVCGCFKGLWDFNEDIKSLLLSLYDLNK